MAVEMIQSQRETTEMEMEMEKSKARVKPSLRKMSLEDYIHFLHARTHVDLTVHQLNQIINMHGYKKIHKTPKKFLSDAVDKIDLMGISRSTVECSLISPIAFTTLEDVIADLKDLNWQECCVTSIHTLYASSLSSKPHVISDDRPPLRTASLQQLFAGGGGSEHQPLKPPALPPPRATKSTANDHAHGPARAVATGPRAKKLVPKRKRSSRDSGVRGE